MAGNPRDRHGERKRDDNNADVWELLGWGAALGAVGYGVAKLFGGDDSAKEAPKRPDPGMPTHPASTGFGYWTAATAATSTDEEDLKTAAAEYKSYFDACESEDEVQETVIRLFKSLDGAELDSELVPVAREWEVERGRSDLGKGDLVFEWRGVDYVVETKYLAASGEARRQGKRDVKNQAKHYAGEWERTRGPERGLPVVAWVATNDHCLRPADADLE